MGNLIKSHISHKEEKLSLDDLYTKTWAITAKKEIELVDNSLTPYQSIGAEIVDQNESGIRIEFFRHHLWNFYLIFEKKFGAYRNGRDISAKQFIIKIIPNTYNSTVNVYGDWKCFNATVQFYRVDRGFNDYELVYHDKAFTFITSNSTVKRKNEIKTKQGFNFNSKYLFEKTNKVFSRHYKDRIQGIILFVTPLPQSIITICLLPFVFPRV